MKLRGVVYDVGLNFSGTSLSVEPFNPSLISHDMSVISSTLHANAVRIEGEEIVRLLYAARAAHANRLSVYFNPWNMNANIDETRAYYEEAAQAAEGLRNEGVDLVFVAGCEYTMFGGGIFPGESWQERAAWLGSQFASLGKEVDLSGDLPDSLKEKSRVLNEVLKSFVEVIRAKFKGLVTYSAGSWEWVDWSIFDIVGVDYYRRGETEEKYVEGLERYRIGKPIAIMEVGCCAYEGAAERGDSGFILLKGTNADGSGIFEGDVVPTRSEKEQADYVGTQLGLLHDSGVHAVFIFVFSFPCMKFGEGARDFDMMSFSLVKTLPNSDSASTAMPPWVPKEAFHRISEFYKSQAVLEKVE